MRHRRLTLHEASGDDFSHGAQGFVVELRTGRRGGGPFWQRGRRNGWVRSSASSFRNTRRPGSNCQGRHAFHILPHNPPCRTRAGDTIQIKAHFLSHSSGERRSQNPSAIFGFVRGSCSAPTRRGRRRSSARRDRCVRRHANGGWALGLGRYGSWSRGSTPNRGARARRAFTFEQRGNVLLRLGDDGKQLSNGNHLTGLNENLAQHPAAHRLDLHIDLVSLNFDDGFPSRDLVPFLLGPFEDLTLCHRIAAFRHQHLNHH